MQPAEGLNAKLWDSLGILAAQEALSDKEYGEAAHFQIGLPECIGTHARAGVPHIGRKHL